MLFYIVMMVSQYDCFGFDLLNRRNLLPGARAFAVSGNRMLNRKAEPHAEFSVSFFRPGTEFASASKGLSRREFTYDCFD